MRSLIFKIFVGVFGLSVLGALFGFSVLAYFSFGLPKISTLADYRPSIPSQILAKDGTVLAEIGTEKREVVAFEDIPKLMINALLSAEDDGFFQHQGVDYMGVLRAMLANIKAGRVVQGGSTITQQVAKSLLLTRERSFTRKIKDFLLAQKIEEKFSKQEILYLYLNQMYFGGGYYGVKAAIRGYFGKELNEITPAEAAMIAGLLVAPGKYSPYNRPKYAKKRQGYVLKRMYATGKITEEEYKKALAEKIQYRVRKKSNFKAGYFTDWVRQRVIAKVGEKSFLRDGYKVHTTLDWEIQKTAEKEVAKGVKGIDKRQGFLGALTTIETVEERDIQAKKFRVDTYRSKSNYFYLGDDNQKNYELVFTDEEWSQTKEFKKENQYKIYKNIRAGYWPEDPFLNLLEEEKSYEAVVTAVDDKARLIFVEIGSISGFIPYAHFSWAHERIIKEERSYLGLVQTPSTIVKVGDVILVDLKEKAVSLLPHVQSTHQKRFKKRKDFKIINKQKYLLCGLDQEADAQGALVSLNPFNSEVVAFVGGSDFTKSQFNRAIQSRRQPGSAFKPILFAAGLENGFTPSSIIIDSPEALGGMDASLNWKPRNYDGKFKGPITYRNSLEQSRNVPTIKIAENLGVRKVLSFVERIGFNAKLDQDLSLALGSFGVTLVDIVSTYGIFPNGGIKIVPKSIISILDRTGTELLVSEEPKILPGPSPSPEEEGMMVAEEQSQLEVEGEAKKMNPFHETLSETQVYDARLAYLMTNLLKGVVWHGTGRQAREMSPYLGGKTGTTNSYVDAWFLGFSANLVTGVWTGFDDNKTLGWGETGAKSALPIWKGFMRHGLKKYGEKDFKVPLGIINVKIDKSTGKLAKLASNQGFLESFVEGTEPGIEKEESVDPADVSNTSQLFEEDDYYNDQ
ncbi:MAG: PBP1A family penicillin-binding protein [Halobacteriovoraceae bacterium]|nr:PBP1A family penicillin-binding protein [Halobacteriovoraceae bacterium]MBT5095163.1 PBP1A family penicillin-binding protein [Halobacteriovoraceae bacterium]